MRRTMKQAFAALRYLAGATAVSLAFALVCFAQAASGAQAQGAVKPAAPTIKEWPADPAGLLVAEWTRAKNWTKEYLDKMPEAGLSLKPTPEIRSFAEQMMHLASANFFYATAATGKPAPYKREDLTAENYKTKAALNKIVLESYDFMIGAIKSLDVAKLDEKITMRGTSLSRAAVLHNGFEHQTHHRGQTTIYLRLKGVVPPAEPFQ
ncbi:MAG: hypothetical protein JMDDDDMK_04589 [Acidobacteria bacterium]|nr:hypothetical protein [Acidobacteriota bacterium]